MWHGQETLDWWMGLYTQWSECALARTHAQEYVPAATYMFKTHSRSTTHGGHFQHCTYTEAVPIHLPAHAVTLTLGSKFTITAIWIPLAVDPTSAAVLLAEPAGSTSRETAELYSVLCTGQYTYM